MPKAQINPIEQQTMVNGQPGNLNYRAVSPEAQFAAGLSQISQNLGNVLYEQNKRLEKLKFADNDEKLKITSGEMNLALSKARNQEEFDAIRKEYTDRMKADSKERLGKLYDKWSNVEGQNFMAAMDVDIKEKQIALNDKIAKETATSTIKDMAYQWGYSTNEEGRKIQDAVFADYLANSDFNDAEKEAFMRKYDHDKEHGYLSQEVVKNPVKVTNLLSDPKNFDNLTIEEREAFKRSAETSEKSLKDSKDKGFDDQMSQKIASVKLESVLRLEKMLSDINTSKTTRDGKTVYDEDKLDFQTVMSAWDYATSLGTDPMMINNQMVVNPSGKITYTLSKGEEFEYKKKLLPAMISAAQMIADNEQGAGNDSAFRFQMEQLSKAAKKSGKMNSIEIADLMRSIWRENQQTDATDGLGWAMKPLESFGNANMQSEYKRKAGDNFQRAFRAYYQTKGNAGVNIETIPENIPVKVLDDKGNVDYETVNYAERQQETIDNLKKTQQAYNPFLYAAGSYPAVKINKE